MMTREYEEIEAKLDLVIEKLIHLGDPENEGNLEDEGEEKGFYRRDFGIREWDWPQGVGLYGLLKARKLGQKTSAIDPEKEGSRKHKQEEYRNFLYAWFKDNVKRGLPSRNINTTAPLLTLAELLDECPDTELEELCLSWADWLMECLPRTKEGGFQHVTSANGDIKGVRLNEDEIWIDTIFMAVLFLDKMGRKYKRDDWADESLHQILIHIKYLCDNQTGLFYHGWTFRERNNFGGVFWCRGNSWFTLGIPEYLDMSAGDINPGVKTFIVDAYRAQAEQLRKLQAKDGLWHTVLDDETSYTEVSGSAAIAAGLIKGIRRGILDDRFRPCVKQAIRGILDNIGEDGTVLKVSGGTAMGYDREHYKNILIAPMAYGQALTILALTEACEDF